MTASVRNWSFSAAKWMPLQPKVLMHLRIKHWLLNLNRNSRMHWLKFPEWSREGIPHPMQRWNSSWQKKQLTPSPSLWMPGRVLNSNWSKNLNLPLTGLILFSNHNLNLFPRWIRWRRSPVFKWRLIPFVLSLIRQKEKPFPTLLKERKLARYRMSFAMQLPRASSYKWNWSRLRHE